MPASVVVGSATGARVVRVGRLANGATPVVRRADTPRVFGETAVVTLTRNLVIRSRNDFAPVALVYSGLLQNLLAALAVRPQS
jgi:hypothetical protein